MRFLCPECYSTLQPEYVGNEQHPNYGGHIAVCPNHGSIVVANGGGYSYIPVETEEHNR